VKTLELFAAKTKLSEICQQVATSGEPCIFTRRGEPLVRLEPARASHAKRERESIWVKRARHLKKHGLLEPDEPDFELPLRLPAIWRDPLA
jgi:antitoxin (DNA-binding transcriptional repressor) of toxin-antitoxin stability system